MYVIALTLSLAYQETYPDSTLSWESVPRVHYATHLTTQPHGTGS
jgi:hypothetical protein